MTKYLSIDNPKFNMFSSFIFISSKKKSIKKDNFSLTKLHFEGLFIKFWNKFIIIEDTKELYKVLFIFSLLLNINKVNI